MPETTHDLGLKTSFQTFDAFVRCTLMGNQPWPQFQNVIRERSIITSSELSFVIKTRSNCSACHLYFRNETGMNLFTVIKIAGHGAGGVSHPLELLADNF